MAVTVRDLADTLGWGTAFVRAGTLYLVIGRPAAGVVLAAPSAALLPAATIVTDAPTAAELAAGYALLNPGG